VVDNQDEMILELAQKIKVERKISLTDAMIQAEEQLKPKAVLPEGFAVYIKCKPRIARWVLSQFEQTKDHTTEERLAAYLGIVLSQVRVTSKRSSEEGPEIQEGGAVSLTRAQFQNKAPRE
jgi:hypothetical protein